MARSVVLPPGQVGIIARAVGRVIRLSDGPLAVRAVGRDVSNAAMVPIFRVGRRVTLRNKTQEYVRQLQRQIDALNRMTPEELIHNLTHPAPRNRRAQREARQEFRQHHVDRRRDEIVLENPDISPEEAMRQAEIDTDEMMETLAVLHEPDAAAGGSGAIGVGPDGAPSMGDRFVNSSIGAQWYYRRDALLEYARRAQAAGEPLRISFVLG